MPSGGAAGRGLFGIIALGVAATVISNSLFNVDGGHRAIKYTRIGGVKKEIYAEGKRLPSDTLQTSTTDQLQEHIFEYPGSRPPSTTMSAPNHEMSPP